MASTGSISSNLVKPQGDNLDIAWQWNSLRDPNNKKLVTCDFCGKTTTGGITRAKKHQMGIRGDTNPCHKTPSEVKTLLKEAMEKKKAEKEAYTNEFLDDDEEEVQIIADIQSGKRNTTVGSSQSTKRTKSVRGPMDLLAMKKPETTIKSGKSSRQTSINDACDKEARARTIQYIARFFYTNGIAFNVAKSKSFKLMVEAIGNYGKHLIPPTYHELRVPLLKKELDYTKSLMKQHEQDKLMYGCSIMSDAWTDRKNRTLINFLVNSRSGSMFVRSVDASDQVKTGEKLFELLDAFVEEVGEKNVVQVITDNGSNYVLAGKLLQAKRHHLFWTPCTAHCIDLILEDIGKIPRTKKAIQNGVMLVGFIYNHGLALNTMRKYTKKAELVRHGVTRFATAFLTLQRLHNQKNNLRKMFISEDWSNSKLAKERKGKMITNIVLNHNFWYDVVYTLKAMAPLFKVLRLVDNEKKPAMGYIYDEMDKVKENIQNAFKGNVEKYRKIFAIIDKRRDGQLHHPLHAAAHYLNPGNYYSNPRIEKDGHVIAGLFQVIEKLSEDTDIVDSITQELAAYKVSAGLFGIQAAIRQRTTLHPATWWGMFGSQTPNLQTLAMKVLSLTCSSSGCERNWSTFEQIHTKKRNKLEHQKLQELVYIKYNQALKDRFDCRDMIDPLVQDGIEDDNEWLTGVYVEDEGGEDDLVFEGDNLTWDLVGRASGADEPTFYTRRQSRLKNSTSTPSSSRGKETTVIEDDESEDGDEEEEEIYKSSSSDDENDKEDQCFDDEEDDE